MDFSTPTELRSFARLTDPRCRSERNPSRGFRFGVTDGFLVFTLALCSFVAMPGGCVVIRDGFSPRQQIRSLLDAQIVAWNAGDHEAFMSGYWQSPDLTFSSGGKVTRGWSPTLERYQTRYPTKESMGRLTFSDLEITTLGHDAALVLGRWRLERDQPVGGVFSLVLRRLGGRWVIVHDHTSKDE